MDMLSANWLTEMMQQEMEDSSFIHQYGSMQSPGDSLDDQFDFFCEKFSSCPNSSPINSNPYLSNSSTFEHFEEKRAAKQLKTSTSRNFCPTGPKTAEASSSSSSCLISFGKSDSKPIATDDTLTFHGNIKWVGKPGNMNFEAPLVSGYYSHQNNQEYSQTYGQESKRLSLTARDPIQNQEHVLAERKRRENINMLFVSLSAIIPGLTKTDKTSVLGDAVKYLKQLQQRVKMLEEQTAKKMVESVVTVKRHQLSDNETSSSYYTSDSSSNQPLLEIEARVSNKDALIRIHCEKKKGLAVKILGEIEKLRLTVINSSCLPFGECIVDMTIVAQMDNDFSMTAKDLVRNLRLAFLQFI